MDEFDSIAMKIKAGDEVVLSTGSYRLKERRIVKVASVTPTGQVNIEGYERRFSRDGYERGGDYNVARLFPLTPELRREVLKERALAHSRQMIEKGSKACEALHTEEAVAIMTILFEAEKRAAKAEVKNG